ncbi:uncharacterized protein PADG_02114 [Paracoccidioides brasiliensis Pb18]|uniref:CREG-like beta-barrel domain-containing protein n=1 Tax=Paracoccidioides brasiliensis (strain Pb18) TaxID=502780 RepID=C1G1U8_PARBD|nr:uncharacterized protein PADG_02114 [Paracoccidioides brasiliensis Pb18]EEH45964.2 hypothetical protein PADG_02114 [Paracoccidioides brasiliensis Pb18]ODH48986.1 hypothetical protein GX48_04919 [Paracoccidioides brasiliensis]
MWSTTILAFIEVLLSIAVAYPTSLQANVDGSDNSIAITAQLPIGSKGKSPLPLPGFPETTSYPTGLDNDNDPVAQPDYVFPSWDSAHLLARRLLALSTTGVLSTVYPPSSSTRKSALDGVPVGFPDYIADCANDPTSELTKLLGPGNPLILALNIGTTFRNTKAGSNISLSIDWWHQLAAGNVAGMHRVEEVSLASLPRVSLLGYLDPLENLSDTTRKAVEMCFVAAHPDAAWWLPGHDSAAHSGYWAKLVVEEAYWIGGFGDRARIGWLDLETWKAVKRYGEDGNEGWADVRLPGE